MKLYKSLEVFSSVSLGNCLTLCNHKWNHFQSVLMPSLQCLFSPSINFAHSWKSHKWKPRVYLFMALCLMSWFWESDMLFSVSTVVWFPHAAITKKKKKPQTGEPNNTHWFLTVLEAGSPRHGKGWFLLRPLSLVYRPHVLPVSSHGRPSVHICVLTTSSYKNPSLMGSGPTQVISFYLIYIFKNLIS